VLDRLITAFPQLNREEVAEIKQKIKQIEDRVSEISDLQERKQVVEAHHFRHLAQDVYTILEILIPQIVSSLKIHGLTESEAQDVTQQMIRLFFCSELAEAIREALLRPSPDYAETAS
jgi:hypothetical protein